VIFTLETENQRVGKGFLVLEVVFQRPVRLGMVHLGRDGKTVRGDGGERLSELAATGLVRTGRLAGAAYLPFAV
jgi:hypothetical protein